MKTKHNGITQALLVSTLLLTACSSGSGGSTPPGGGVNSFTVAGSVNGLTGTGLVLQNNGGDNITIPAGSTSFIFPTSIANGANYSVSVLVQPTSPLQLCTVSNGTGIAVATPNNISLVCSIKSYFAYVANPLSNNISAYSIDTNTGALSTVAGNPFTAGIAPNSVIVDPTNKFVYVTNEHSINTSNGSVSWIGYVFAYSINANTGALTAVSGSPVVSGTMPVFVTVDPTGKFVYVANHDSYNISAYSINNTTGALTSIGTMASQAVGINPLSVSVDPTGKFVYVANSVNAISTAGFVSAYTINASTGALADVTGSPFATQISPDSITVDPTGKFVYVANGGSNNITAFNINSSTGALSEMSSSPFAAGSGPSSVVVTPNGKFVYVANPLSKNISAYIIDTSTGALTPVAGSPFISVTTPISVTVDPTNKFVYVANGGSNNTSAYSINASTGALTAVAGSPFVAGTNPFSIATTH